MSARFAYACQEALADHYRQRGGVVLVRFDRNGSRRVQIDGGRWVNVATAMRVLERAYRDNKP